VFLEALRDLSGRYSKEALKITSSSRSDECVNVIALDAELLDLNFEV
jgi:hypothetical protein